MLSECNIQGSLSEKVIDDVFGKKLGSVLVEGIVDATDDDDFHNKLVSLQHPWRDHDSSSTTNINKFIECFVAKKVPLMAWAALQTSSQLILGKA